MSETGRRVSADRLARFIADALKVAGLAAEDALKVGHLMSECDVIGGDAHGVFRLPQYVRRLRAGGYNPSPNIRIASERTAMALVDGDNAMGHLVMSRAAEIAIEKAKTA